MTQLPTTDAPPPSESTPTPEPSPDTIPESSSTPNTTEPNIFYARSDQDASQWLTDRAAQLEATGVPRDSWVAESLHLLGDEVKLKVTLRASFRKAKVEEWEWTQFSKVLLDVVGNIRAQKKVIEKINHPKEQSSLARFREEHPVAAVATGVGLVVATPIVAPLAMVGVLHAVGFSAGGLVAGSVAAGVHSVLYGGAVAITAGGAAAGMVGASQLIPRKDSDEAEEQLREKAEEVSTAQKEEKPLNEEASKDRLREDE
ncbi:hypothetical protein C8F01DRAFT_1369210 [Mycena amicta]|nr:hypothetical protein C8F01DRAFT_1369210 [Mycena amicta]